MKKLIYLIMAVIIFNVAAALDYHSDRLNVPITGINHTQIVTGNGNITVTIPNGWVIINYSPSGTVGIGDITFSNVTGPVFYTMQSPAAQTEGTTFVSEIYENNIKQGQFLFVAVPDDKVLNCKSELGHGESNWIDTDYLPNTDISLFNMIRVFPLGSYYNEDATNASVTCVLPKYHVLVSQGTLGSSFEHNPNNVTAHLYWDNLGKNWFRVAPIEQEVTNQTLGENYSIVCDTLTYEYTHGTIVANNPQCMDFEFRNPIAFNLTEVKPCADLITITCGNFSGIGNTCSTLQCVDGMYMFEATNIEKYTVYDVEFKWTVGNGDVITRNVRQIEAGETLGFYVGVVGTGTIQMDVSYVPEWYKNALAPHYQIQSASSVFSLGTGEPRLGDALFAKIERGNNIVMSDNDQILMGEKYRARVYVNDFFGTPIDPDSTPKIKLIDPIGNTILSPTLMTKEGTGSYSFEHLTTGYTNGVWEAISQVNINGELIERNDYFDVKGNPAQVQIRAIDTSIPSIVCRVTLQNEGLSSQEYNFKYWVTSEADGQWSDNSSIDSGSAAKLLQPGEVYITDKSFNVPITGEYWCKVLVYWDAESSAASDKFTATSGGGIVSSPETCYNGIDDDGDGFIDSLDPQCANGGTTESSTLFSFLDFREKGPWLLLLVILALILIFGRKKEKERRGNYIDIPY